MYSDDADDIKAHPWFRNTDWAQNHNRKPPFVPKVKGWEDTKYFDNEPVSDIASSSSEEDEEPNPIPEKENILRYRLHQTRPASVREHRHRRNKHGSSHQRALARGPAHRPLSDLKRPGLDPRKKPENGQRHRKWRRPTTQLDHHLPSHRTIASPPRCFGHSSMAELLHHKSLLLLLLLLPRGRTAGKSPKSRKRKRSLRG